MIQTDVTQLDPDRRTAPQIYDLLRDKILSLELPPNSVLVRAEIQQQFGVSQTPVRDALIRLERDGLVDVFPQHATRVSKINLRSAREVHFMRQAVEVDAVRKAATDRTDVDVDQLRALLDQMIAASGVDQLTTADEAFHGAIFRIAGLTSLHGIIKGLSVHMLRLRKLHLPLPGKRDSVIADHRMILNALVERDAEGAGWAMRRHLSGTLSMLPAISETYPDYLSNPD